jgi:hypothetical protein
MRKTLLAAGMILLGSMTALAAQIEEPRLTSQDSINWLEQQKWQEAASQCTGRFCCCDLRSRGVICAPRSKCTRGARCLGRTNCPR